MACLRVAVLGVGNVLRRDDGVGVHVIGELRRQFRFPDGVRLVDGGLGGPGLLGVVEGVEALIAVDAVRGGHPPGTLYRIPASELLRAGGGGPGSMAARVSSGGLLSYHEAGLLDLIAAALQAEPGLRAIILGVEPAETREWGMELSEPVAARVPQLVDLVLTELTALGVGWERAGEAG